MISIMMTQKMTRVETPTELKMREIRVWVMASAAFPLDAEL